MQYKNVVVTGGSSGLGYELAEQLARQCQNLVLVSKDPNRLERAVQRLKKPGNAKILPVDCDLSSNTGIEKLISGLESSNLQFDLFVNNAGFGLSGYFVDNNWDELSEMINLNVIAVAKLGHWAANHMKNRTRSTGNEPVLNQDKAIRGTVINVSAMAAIQPSPFFAAFGATRSFVTSLSVALHEEMKDYGVRVICAHPGSIKSEFEKRANIGTTLAVKMLGYMPASFVASVILKKASRGRPFFIVGFPYKLIYLFYQITPRWIALKQMRMLFQ